ncbi:hypothetical protein LTR37_010489 [Vermiconidia calcicola]|uniref:Uncharacterized protein n=1 Tax=Vermiconidia calcicola TaxID=1690605 RepID=A0ACC3N4V8_9PEZI|nr:hypothetical protein LTR37_010489 [Vermiconidia calcicola]
MAAAADTEKWNTLDPFTQDVRGSNEHLDGSRETKPDTESHTSSTPVVSNQPKRDHSHSDHDTAIETVKNAASEAKYHLQGIRATGPSKLFNPTNVRMHVRFRGSEDQSNVTNGPSTETSTAIPRPQSDVNLLWRSRDNRKGRGSIAVPRMPDLENSDSHIHIGRTVSSAKQIFKNILKMCTTFPYWNLAFWSGLSYALGSVLFVAGGAWAFQSAQFPNRHYANEEKLVALGVPIATFIGVLCFQAGATAAYLEAVNDGSMHGSAMRRLLEGHEEDEKKILDEKIHVFFSHAIPHPHKKKDEEEAERLAGSVDPEAGWRTREKRERPGSVYPSGKAPAPRRGGMDLGEAEEGDSSEYMTWRWWPTWHALRTHHAYEIGYLACSIQGFGATIYGKTGLVLLPGVWASLGGEWGEMGAYWIPQMFASLCFITASVMFTLETQEKWWKPQINVLGWWIGFTALLGSIGFELCAVFGAASYYIEPWPEIESSLSSMWGSAFFLISSLLQWYEAINKHPVAELFSEPGEMKSHQVHPI